MFCRSIAWLPMQMLEKNAARKSRAAKLKGQLQGVIFYYPMKIMHFLKK